MAIVNFTPNLRRYVEAPRCEVLGSTVREALDAVFASHPRLRGYVLDEQGRLRKHVVVFVDGKAVADRLELGDPVRPESELFVMQALSGG